jgi:hypothetical protein
MNFSTLLQMEGYSLVVFSVSHLPVLVQVLQLKFRRVAQYDTVSGLRFAWSTFESKPAVPLRTVARGHAVR